MANENGATSSNAANDGAEGHASVSLPAAPEDASAAVFRREAEYWTIIYDGQLLRLRDAKGLQSLAHLLARPCERLAASALLALDVPDAPALALTPEQARVVATKRLKGAIKKIATHHPALGFHLTSAVKTGHHCAYLPDPARPFSWVL